MNPEQAHIPDMVHIQHMKIMDWKFLEYIFLNLLFHQNNKQNEKNYFSYNHFIII